MIDLSSIDRKIFDKVVNQLSPLTDALNEAKNELEKDPKLKAVHGEAVKKAESILRESKNEAIKAKEDIEKLKNYK